MASTVRLRKMRSWEITEQGARGIRARNPSSHSRRGEVQVVGRLVEQEQVGRLQQEGGEAEPGLLAAGEGREEPVLGDVADAQAGEHGVDPVGTVVAGQVLEFLGQRAVLGEQRGQIGAWQGHGGFDGVQAVLDGEQVFLGLGQHLLYGEVGGAGEHLRQVANAHASRQLDATFVRLELPDCDPEERGLADSVGAHDPDRACLYRSPGSPG